MKNFIPLDFYDANKTTVYATKKLCIEAEGSAFEFDPNSCNLMISKFENGTLVIDPIKQEAVITAENLIKNEALVRQVEIAQLKAAYNIINGWNSLNDINLPFLKKFFIRILKDMRE